MFNTNDLKKRDESLIFNDNDFNQLPFDLQSNILKYSPYMKSLNKTYNQNTVANLLYYQEQCHLPISKKEFINYIEQYNPKYFAVFESSEQVFTISVFHATTHPLYYNRDYYEYVKKSNVIYYNFNFSSESIHIYYKYINNSQSYYDLNLTLNILKERPCLHYNPNYIYNYINNQFNTLVYPIVFNQHINHVFIMLKQIIYMMMSYQIYHHRYNINFDYYLDEVSFIIYDDNGLPIDDQSDLMKIYKNDYDVYHAVMVNLIKTL